MCIRDRLGTMPSLRCDICALWATAPLLALRGWLVISQPSLEEKLAPISEAYHGQVERGERRGQNSERT